MTVHARNGTTRTMADCVTCGQECPSTTDTPAVQQAWARRHAADNPGHRVHATSERVRIYEADADA